jgi:hypothetical protein
LAERRSGMMIDDRMQLYFGEAHLPETAQKLRQIPFRLLAHSRNLDAVEQRRSVCILGGKTQCAACSGCQCGEAEVISAGGHVRVCGTKLLAVHAKTLACFRGLYLFYEENKPARPFSQDLANTYTKGPWELIQ